MKKILSTLVAFFVLALAGCDGSLPGKSDIVAEFKREHPTATVISATVGEGDSEHTYWTIGFTEPGDSKVKKIEWGTRAIKESGWEIFHKKEILP